MRILAALVAFMFAAITTRLWYLQVLATDQFNREANENQLRLVPIEPVRGEILDRNGEVLVANKPTTVILVDREQMQGQDEEIIRRLSKLLKIPVGELVDRLNSVRYLPYQPVPVAEGVEPRSIVYIEEHKQLFQGVSYAVDAGRRYPFDGLAAHVLGYVGEVSQEQLDQPQFKDYEPGEIVGKAGVELEYERFLQGVRGTRGIRINAQGRVLDDTFGGRAPVPGDNVVLAIDQKIQSLTERSLSQGIALARRTVDRERGLLKATGGAAVVMDPRNGQVLALASYPTFDPSIFSGGISTKDFAALMNPAANYPLLDRAIQSGAPAGSTFKPFVLAASLREHFVRTDHYYPCPPEWRVPGSDPSVPAFGNWDPIDRGSISLAESLKVSCDTVYYPMGWDFWTKYYGSDRKNEAMQDDLRRMGFGLPTGADLPSEFGGVIPTQEYKKQLFRSAPDVYGRDSRWYPGDYVNMSIGQGFVQVTPMQLAVAYSAIANGGTLWEPHVALKIESPNGRTVERIEPKRTGRLPVSKKIVAYIQQALRGVVEPGGTAGTAFTGFPLTQFPVAGKTGTALVDPKQPYSWFAAMAPADHPRYVVVAMVEQGGHGATTAAPLVRRILEGLFGISGSGQLQTGGVSD
jgi:penicillin-binding protein 2